MLCFSHATVIFTDSTKVTTVYFKLCHLKDKGVKIFSVLTTNGGEKLKNRKKEGKDEDMKEGPPIEFHWTFPQVNYILSILTYSYLF
jgi:hypothetical protein